VSQARPAAGDAALDVPRIDPQPVGAAKVRRDAQPVRIGVGRTRLGGDRPDLATEDVGRRIADAHGWPCTSAK
jgi:hypothetical protein